MRKQFGLFCCAALLSASAFAQTEINLEEQYAPLYPDSKPWYETFKTWTPGSYINDNFFISRVRPRTRFTNDKTQVYPEVDANGKKILWWMPISNGGWPLNLPQYTLKNDNFSLWSYIDIHGGWNQPFIRSSGTFGDACHKNGVKNSMLIFFDGTAGGGSTINYLNPGNNETAKAFKMLFEQNGTTFTNVPRFIQMLKYYGISGISVNPEMAMTSATATKFQEFMIACREEAGKQGWGDQWNVAWYDAMTNTGNVSFTANALYASNQDWFAYKNDRSKVVSEYFFLNYNHDANRINQSIKQAETLSRSPYDVYVGQHIGGRGLGDSWQAIMESKISLGTWGEHSQNNIFYNSTDKGSNNDIVSKVYTEKLEMFFSGGNRNPLNVPAFITQRGDLSYSSFQNFNGVAKWVAAKSALSELPFITYFGLGSGLNNSEKGEVFSKFQWYNLGMQDHMPTWRWWVADDTGNVPAKPIQCDLSYEDAWIGGNSLKLSGETTKSNVRLFKTKFAVKGSEKMSLTFKLKGDKDSKMNIIYSVEGSEGTLKSIPVGAATAADTWTTKTWTLSDLGLNNGDVIACLGVSLAGTPNDYEAYLGEFSIVDPAKTYNPVKPTLVTSGYDYKLGKSAYNYEMVKLIWNSKVSSEPWDIIYNDDVDTWYFEVMVKEDGKEEKLAVRTTSWAVAALLPVDMSCKKFKVGVRAVAPDGKTRSDIAWLDQEFDHNYSFMTDIVYESGKLVPNEEFTISLQDPTIPTAHWELLDETGTKIAEMEGTSFTASGSKVGLYSVKVRFDNPLPGKPDNVYEKTYTDLIQVTPESTGRKPKANFTYESEVDVTQGAKAVTFNFNGVKGEGKTSKAVSLEDGSHFFAFNPAIIGKPTQITFAAWVKPTEPHGQIMSLRSSGGNPSWGSVWVYAEGTPNRFFMMGRDRGADFKDMDSKIEAKMFVWYHIAMVLNNDDGMQRFYINGKLVAEQKVNFKSSYDLYSLGTESFQGTIDEVQIWNKALTSDQVKEAMYGYTPGNIPADLKGYWVFEDSYNGDANKYPNIGNGGDYPGGIYKGTANSFDGFGAANTVVPNITSGSSWLSGNTDQKSTLTWNFKGASNVDLSNPEAPVVTYDKAGEYPAKLVIENTWGKDTKEVIVKVTDGTVNIVEARNEAVTVTPTVFEDEFTVSVIESGKYAINVYDAKGLLVKAMTKDCSANENVYVGVDSPSGIYFVRVAKDGMVMKREKVVKK